MTEFDTVTPETIGKRLKEARDAAGLSRARLGDITDISPRVIEKIEAGTQEASTTRLRSLCHALEIDPAEFLGTRDKPELPRDPAAPVLPNMAPLDRASLILEEIDGLRADGFEGATRKAMALAGMAKNAMAYLEPEELNRLARLRGLAKHQQVDGLDIVDLFDHDPRKAHAYCGALEDRIVDTAILGLDLFTLDEEEIEALADELAEMKALESPGFLGAWPELEELYPRMQPAARQVVTAGKPLQSLADASPI